MTPDTQKCVGVALMAPLILTLLAKFLYFLWQAASSNWVGAYWVTISVACIVGWIIFLKAD
jgi:hypothetical protein